MRIIKVNKNGQFNFSTEHPTISGFSALSKETLHNEFMPLHHYLIEETCYDFIGKYFPINHFIYEDFGNSHYFINNINKLNKI